MIKRAHLTINQRGISVILWSPGVGGVPENGLGVSNEGVLILGRLVPSVEVLVPDLRVVFAELEVHDRVEGALTD